MENLVGRHREVKELTRCLCSERSEFVVVSGRRRIGKTFLVNMALKGLITFSYIGSHKSSKQRQLQKFSRNLLQSGLCSVLPQLNTWYDAFDALESLLSKMNEINKKVLFFDEMPWIDTPGSEFVAALEDFWNGWASLRYDIMLIACGSATSWLVDHLIENQGGLHNRVTSRIALQPFNLAECKEYVSSRDCPWDNYQIAQMYMYIGGVPFYWSLLDLSKGVADNVDILFFAKNAKLKGEFDELYQVLFHDSEAYVEIMRLLSKHHNGLSRKEIATAIGSSGGTLSKRLANLERCNFVMAQTPVGNKSKGVIYRAIDFYTLFYIRFIETEHQFTSHYWQTKITSPSILTWQGLTFETMGMAHIDQIRMALGIYGVSVRCSAWRSKTDAEGRHTQIDLVIERADRITHLCEFKFSSSEFVITADYAQRLRERQSIYRSQTKTHNTLLTTFVTPYGVNRGKNYSVVQGDITLDQLFTPVPTL